MWETIKETVKGLLGDMTALLVVFGAIFVALGAAGGVTYNSWFPIKQDYWQITIVIIGSGMIVIGTLVGWKRPARPLRSADYYGIKITYPHPHAQISGKVNVTGTIKRLPPSGYELSLLRVFPSGDYMPVSRVELKRDGTWEALDVDIGGEKGDRREIAAYLVGKAGRKLLEYYKAAASVHGVARRISRN
jgi:hypothetical protein